MLTVQECAGRRVPCKAPMMLLPNAAQVPNHSLRP
jgi:hypothetical protein